MKKVWVIVANSSQAKIYRAENVNTLIEHAIFFHDESRMQAQDLVSDNSGRETAITFMSEASTYEPKLSLKDKEAHIFALTLAQFLEQAHTKGEFEKIYLVAKSPFLGHLRQALKTNVLSTLVSEIHKDLTLSRPEEIREYLPPVL